MIEVSADGFRPAPIREDGERGVVTPVATCRWSRLRISGSTVGAGTDQLKGKFADGGLSAVANVASIARRSRAHFKKVREVGRRIHEDGIVTPLEEAEWEEVTQEHELFELAGETSHQVRQATDRATDQDRLGDVWAMHLAVIDRLPAVAMPLNA